jgi:hypothetical protein
MPIERLGRRIKGFPLSKMSVIAALAAAALFVSQAPISHAEGLREACHGDVQKFCADVHGMAVVHCMKQHASELSDECKSAWKSHHKPQPGPAASESTAPPQ